MINTFEQINWRPKEKDIIEFSSTFFYGTLVIAAVFFVYISFSAGMKEAIYPAAYLMIFGGLTVLIANVDPKLIKIFYFLWVLIGASIGIIISNVLLLFFYYLIFAPFAFALRKITKRDPLNLQKPKGTNWHDVKAHDNLKRYFKQY